MFSPVILILLSIWTSTYGDMVCDTLSGVACDFPFRRTADGPEFKTCQRGAEGRTWCATSKIAATGVYDTWGYCNPNTCKEVPSIEDARQKVKNNGACYACIEQAAIGPPPNPSSRQCLQPCVFFPFKPRCHFELLATGTRQCLEPCGFITILDDSFPAPAGPRPACVRVGQEFVGGEPIKGGTIQLFSAASCGNHCNQQFPTQCAAWNWNSGSAPTNRRQCVCLKGADVQTKIAAGVRSGYGPANSGNHPICPPK